MSSSHPTSFVLRAAGLWGLLACALASHAAQYRSVGDEPAVFYDAPSAKAKRVFALSPGYPLEVLVAVKGWTKVRDAGGSIGWVEAGLLTNKRGVVVRATVADVRTAGESGAKVVFKAARGVVLEWVETMPGGWVRVRHPEGGPGYVQASDVWGS